MKIKFNKSDFKKFQKMCLELQDLFGLNGVQLVFYHKPLDGFATCSHKYESQIAVLVLTSNKMDTDISKEEELIDTARHEMLELFLSQIQVMVQNKSDDGDIEAETHSLIHKLQKLIWG